MVENEIALAWSDLTYSVKPHFWKEKKTILNNLHGFAKFGTITALMGPSGSGKTTLLNCINGKLREGLDANTKFYLNKNQRVNSAFVTQHEKEHLIMCLTVEESLLYASKLKNSDLNIKNIDHDSNVNIIMDDLMIRDISSNRVDCCSGGQQKRLTIAMEMVRVNKLNLLCIDEPTTGLDSNVAEIVMICLRNLAKKHNICIITSIHQPNQEVLLMFDKIYVLAKGGDCIYNGLPFKITAHLIGNCIDLDEDQLPIEQLLRLGSEEIKQHDIDKMIEKTREIIKISGLKECQNQTEISDNGIERKGKSFRFLDVWYVMLRSMTQLYIRQWQSFLTIFGFYIGFGICACKMFNKDIGKPNACFNSNYFGNSTCLKELENNTLLFQNQNFLFLITLYTIMIHLCWSALLYCSETKIFLNEHQNSWYSTGSYFLAKEIIGMIPTIIIAVIYSSIIYYISGQLLDSHRIIGFVVIVTIGFLITESIGHMSGIMFHNFSELSGIVSITIGCIMLNLANFYIRIQDLPIALQYISDFCFSKYMFNNVLILVYGLNRCSNDQNSVIMMKYGLTNDELIPSFIKLIIYFLATKMFTYIFLYCIAENWMKFDNFSRNPQKSKQVSELNNSRKLSLKRYSIIDSKITFNKTNSKSCKNNNEVKRLISIAWTDLTFCISKSLFMEQKTILNQINGFFEFGTINALMGPSGAGKSTFLNSINGFHPNYLSDKTKIYSTKLKKITTCLITQNHKDHTLDGLTAKEAIIYSSKLKNPMIDFDHKKNAENIMNELMISNTFDTNVENCSGGEQKRLVIAMEMTSAVKPNLLCIDEPTSGLDSTAAEVVIECLKNLTEKHNICVITSIHSPNNYLLNLYDKLYVLSDGGHCVYSGSPHLLSKHLSMCNISLTEEQFPIEIILKYSSKHFNYEFIKKMVEITKESEMKLFNERANNEIKLNTSCIKQLPKRFFVRDLMIILERRLKHNIRGLWKTRLTHFIALILVTLSLRLLFDQNIGIHSGCISFDDDFNNTCFKTENVLEDEERLETNLKYNLLLVIFTLLFTVTLTVLSFASELKLFLIEQNNGWYSTGVYYWSKTIEEFIPLVISTICVAFIANMYETSRNMFYFYSIFLTLGMLEAQSIAHVVGILAAENTRLGFSVIIGVFMYFYMFSNFLFPIKELHYSLQLLSNLSTLKLVVDSLMILFYGLNRCSDREFSYILYLLDIEDIDLYFNIYLLIAQFFIFRAIALIILILKVSPIFDSKEDQAHREKVLKRITSVKYDEIIF